MENKTTDDGLTLYPSQDKKGTSPMICEVLPEDDLHLVLSQSQKEPEASPEAGLGTSSERGQITPSGSQPETLVALSDVTSEELLHISSTTATLRSDFTNVEAMLSRNNAAALEHHHELINVMRGISTNMNQLTDRLEYIEKNMIVMNRKVLKNASDITEAKLDINTLNNTVKTLQNNQPRISVDVENRLVAIENRLNIIKDNALPSDGSLNIMTYMDNIQYENTVIIKNLPDKKSDEFDTNALIGVGLCEDVLTKRVERLESHNNKSGVLRVELYSLEDKMKILKSKQRLRSTNEYYDVYIEDYKTRAELSHRHYVRGTLQRKRGAIVRNNQSRQCY